MKGSWKAKRKQDHEMEPKNKSCSSMKRPVVATSRYIKFWMIIGNVGWDVWFEKETQ